MNPSEDKHGEDSAALVRDLRHGSWTAQIEEMLNRAADRIEELERQCVRFELAACCPDERACEKASASSSCAATKPFAWVLVDRHGKRQPWARVWFAQDGIDPNEHPHGIQDRDEVAPFGNGENKPFRWMPLCAPVPESEATVAFHKLLQDEGEGPDAPAAPTPRTDKVLDEIDGPMSLSESWHLLRDHARQLERELAEVRHDLERAVANHAADLSASSASAEPVAWMIDDPKGGYDAEAGLTRTKHVADAWAKAFNVEPLYRAPVPSIAAIVPNDQLQSGAYYWWKGNERMPWQPVFVRPGETFPIQATHGQAYRILFGEFVGPITAPVSARQEKS